ncbi:MAG TPA: pilin [Amycolatopsis sp.]
MRLISHRPAHRAPARSVPEGPTSRPRSRRRPVVILGCTLIASALLLGGSAAHADTVQHVALAQSVDQVLSNIRSWIMGILAGVALVFLTIGGLRYLMASNDPGEIEKAKGAFKAAGIGFGLAALAPLVVEILKTIVGGV